MKFMKGKRGLIIGVANEYSLAWGIAEVLHAHGAELAFTYQNAMMEKWVRPLADSVGSPIILPCDVSEDSAVKDVARTLQSSWPSIDFVVHAIAFADKNDLKGLYVHVSRQNFLRTLDISCYSFTSVVQNFFPLMSRGGSFLTLTHHGAQQVMPNYNVMGVAKGALESSIKYLAMDMGGYDIRVNGLSAGPVRTLAASGIGGFNISLKWNRNNAPLHRNITLCEVGKSALYLLSDLASGVTGEIHYVDAGYNIVGMKALDASEIANN